MSDPTQVQESGGGEGAVPQIKQESPADVHAAANKPLEQLDIKVEIKKEIEDATENENAELGNLSPEETVDAVGSPPSTLSFETVDVKVEIEQETDKSENASEKLGNSSGEASPDQAAGTASEKNVTPSAVNSDWQTRERELLNRIAELENVKTEGGEEGGLQANAIQLQLKVREDEIDLLKARVKNLEMELQAALSNPNAKNKDIVEKIKQQHEELLSKARGMLFDKTKIVKNQELQIEALTTQVQSLKDINQITKDLLEIRNSEVKAMEDRLAAMEARFKAEKEKHSLMLQRAQTSSGLNDDLRKEYETQLAIFKELRVKYEQRVQALVTENKQLKEINEIKGGPSG